MDYRHWRRCYSCPCVYTPPSFFPASGNTPIAVWGTHLDLIQNPQIRAKHGGKEHINVSPGLAGAMGAVRSACGFPKGCGAPRVLRKAHPEH